MDIAERPASTETIYHGFISYAHTADDLLAPRLQSGLQRFAKPWGKPRALRILLVAEEKQLIFPDIHAAGVRDLSHRALSGAPGDPRRLTKRGRWLAQGRPRPRGFDFAWPP